MELDLSGASEDRGFDVGVLAVDGCGAGVDVRLRNERHAEHTFGEMTRRKRGGEARLHLVFEERLELFGWTWKKDDDLADGRGVRVEDGGVEILRGGAPVFVVDDGGAV